MAKTFSHNYLVLQVFRNGTFFWRVITFLPDKIETSSLLYCVNRTWIFNCWTNENSILYSLWLIIVINKPPTVHTAICTTLRDKMVGQFWCTLICSENVRDIGRKNPEMFRPIAVRKRLTMPYGRKISENLKQWRQTVVVAFFWENGRPLRLCSRRMDKGGLGQ